ncbi:uncharacterized protein LOC124343279 [Daphnia pulicaria]|uniref:uncharacterized protein LOC124343279 n=1 Tax=Daphnia pulicaria TaxID=35523 RepID=UPI001EEC499E|nr:uncharacterized protein LOC124343279 [Daphnia pulicaria]
MEPAASSGMSGIRGTQRPRSLCDSKLLSVTPHGLHHHHSVQQQSSGDQQQQQQLVVKRPPPPLPLSPPRAEPSKYRGSWPSMIYYGGGHDQLQQDADAFVRLEQQKRAPSMAGLMNTTVPQRLVVRPPSLRNSGPRHTPTRNSLRHSRMICLSQQQQGKVPRKYLPPVIHHYRMGSTLVVIQVLLGSVLLALGFHLLHWSPQLNIRDIPHWSGIPVMLSGIFGLFLLCCCRKQYPGMRGGCCVFVVRVQYIICNACLAMLATAACVCACVFASVHVSQLVTMECQSPTVNATLLVGTAEFQLNSTCLCIGGERQDEVFTYDPLSCSEVLQVLPIYLTASAVTNGLAVLVSSWYIVLLWSNRFAYTYAGLKLSEFNANTAMPSLYQ